MSASLTSRTARKLAANEGFVLELAGDRYPDAAYVLRNREMPVYCILYSKRGAYIRTIAFDVPDQEYDDGWLTGWEAAIHALDHLKAHGLMHTHFLRIVQEAVEVRAGDGRRGAAAGFLGAIERALQVSMRALNLHQHLHDALEDQRARCEAFKKRRALEDAAEKQALVARLQRGREEAAAKRARRDALDARKAPADRSQRKAAEAAS